MSRRVTLSLAGAVLLAASCARGAEGGGGHSGDGLAVGLLSLVVLMLSAKLGAELFERMRQPAVLGELAAGTTLSGLGLAGLMFVERMKDNAGLQAAAEIGVILLLFEVGLESRLSELLEVGLSALMVATLGVIVPILLGYGVSVYFLASEPWYVHLFVGSTLAATSVGITARVLRDLGKVDTKEGRIILGAAVVDDVLGLIVLAVISGIVSSMATVSGGGLGAGTVVWIVLKAIGFLAGAIVIGRYVHLNALRAGARFRVPGMPLVIALSFCFALAACAGLAGLAPIVGAFAAGLVLEPSDYKMYRERCEMPIDAMIKPLVTVLTPIFFIVMGLRVDLTAFASGNVLGFAAVVTLAAILGKQICALGVLERGVNRLAVGIGMIPRGEVGLIFTSLGARLAVAGKPVFSTDTVSAMVVMVIVSTLVTPPVLKMVLMRRDTAGR